MILLGCFKPTIILFQENNIKKLNKLVQSLQEQLMQCRGGTRNEAVDDTTSSLTELLNELEQKQILEEKSRSYLFVKV